MSNLSAKLRHKCNVWIGVIFLFKKLVETIDFIWLIRIFIGRSIEYQLINRKQPNVIELHDEKVNESSITYGVFSSDQWEN